MDLVRRDTTPVAKRPRLSWLLEHKEKVFPLHRFSADCRDAVNTLLQVSQKELDFWVAANPVYVAGSAGEVDRVRWCDTCFPEDEDGGRISWGDLEQFTGLTSEQMIGIVEEVLNLAVNNESGSLFIDKLR